MNMNMELTLTLDEIEKAVREYVTKNLPGHTIDGKLNWNVSPGYSDPRESLAPSVSSVKMKMKTDTTDRESRYYTGR